MGSVVIGMLVLMGLASGPPILKDDLLQKDLLALEKAHIVESIPVACPRGRLYQVFLDTNNDPQTIEVAVFGGTLAGEEKSPVLWLWYSPPQTIPYRVLVVYPEGGGEILSYPALLQRWPQPCDLLQERI